ncbi:MAG: hypothetical protein J6T72_02050 [Alphaproteobacteria bacterium]|nr:hypothetical protein [Alphaproteobacteria bacterium]
MFSEERLYQDLEKVCRTTNAIYVNYSDVHVDSADMRAEKVNNFVQLAKKIHKGLTPKTLKNCNFLFRDINGGYRINIMRSVEISGGGSVRTLNYSHNKTSGKGRILFFFGDETFIERQTIYHEVGHLLQQKLKIFNLKYVKEKCLAQKKQKFPKSFYADYWHYLREAHADAFGFACMLLRAENRQERAKNTIYAYQRSGRRLLAGMFDEDKGYASGNKHYSDFGAQKATVKEVNRWFSNDDLSLYCDANGEIDFEALALRVGEIVDKHAMSPRVFYNFLQSNLWQISTKNKNWQTSVPQAFAFACVDTGNGTGVNQVNAKLRKHEEIDERKWESNLKSLEPYDEAAEVLNTCCDLDNAYTKLAQIAAKEGMDVTQYSILDTDKILKYGKLPPEATDTLIEQIRAESGVVNNKLEQAVHNYVCTVNKIMHFNKADTGLALNVMQSSNQSNKMYELMWQMYYARLENPQAKIDLKKLQINTMPMTVKKVHKQEMKIFDVLTKEIINNDVFDNLSSSPSEAHKMRAYVIEHLTGNNPEKVADNLLMQTMNYNADNDEKLRSSLKKIFTLHYINGEVFESSANRYLQSLRNLNDKNLANKSDNKPLNKNSGNQR